MAGRVRQLRQPDGGFVPGSERISGTEEITLRSDGTYTQRFQSSEFTYERSDNRWELLDHPSEGSKLVMHNLVYFAHGLKLTEGPLELFPQRADVSRYKQLRSETGIEAEKVTVNYPADGFVYLYPRNCLGKLQLLQMTSSWGDPDAQAPLNPMFSRGQVRSHPSTHAVNDGIIGSALGEMQASFTV
jgi:hypothetical protein